MRRIFLAAVVGLLCAGTAHAADFCIDFAAQAIVLKGFKPPKPGKCKFIKGAYFSIDTLIEPQFGTACTNTAGDKMRVGMSYGYSSYSVVGTFEFPYPSMTGGTFRYTQSAVPNTVLGGVQAASGAPCAAPVPIP